MVSSVARLLLFSHPAPLRTRCCRTMVSVCVLGLLWAPSALAGTGGGGAFPWDPLLDSLVQNIGGPTLRNILIIAIIGAGIGFYFSAEGTFIRSAFGLVIGFSIAAAAATWGPSFFGVSAASPPHPGLAPPRRWFDALPLAGRLLLWGTVAMTLWYRLADVVAPWWHGREGRP